MEILLIVGFIILWLSCMLWLVLCSRLFKIIKTRHPQKHTAMGGPHVTQNSTLSTNKALFSFLYHRDWIELGDPGLSTLGRFMRGLMIALFTCFALIFLSIPFLFTLYS